MDVKVSQFVIRGVLAANAALMFGLWLRDAYAGVVLFNLLIFVDVMAVHHVKH